MAIDWGTSSIPVWGTAACIEARKYVQARASAGLLHRCHMPCETHTSPGLVPLSPADFGWMAAAAATPSIMLLAGAGFFGLSLAANQGISVAGMDPAAMAVAGVMAGAVTQVRCRGRGPGTMPHAAGALPYCTEQGAHVATKHDCGTVLRSSAYQGVFLSGLCASRFPAGPGAPCPA